MIFENTHQIAIVNENEMKPMVVDAIEIGASGAMTLVGQTGFMREEPAMRVGEAV